MDPMFGSKSERRVLPGRYDSIFGTVCAVAESRRITVTFADPAAGIVRMSKSWNLLTWGEDLAALLRPVPTGVEVTLSSSLKFGPIDWGQNRRNVNTLFRLISKALPAGWYSDPSGRHELRWWEGRWTEAVNDGGQVGTDAL
jgi:hypothetical protein